MTSQQPIWPILHEVSTKTPIALGTNVGEPAGAAGDCRRGTTQLTLYVYLCPFEGWLFQPRSRNNRPDDLVAGVGKFVALGSFANEVPLEFLEVVVELCPLLHANSIADRREPHRIIFGPWFKHLPENQQDRQSGLIS
jgi:hypothetical protein